MSYGYQDDHLNSRRTGGRDIYPTPSPGPLLNQSTQSASSQPSSYSVTPSYNVDSYYSTENHRAPSPHYAQPAPPNTSRGPSPTHQPSFAPSAYRAPSPNYDPPYNPQHHPGMQQSRPSFSSYHTDLPDETRSFSSTTHLAQKEGWDVGAIVPSVPPVPHQYSGYPPPVAPYSASPYGQPMPSPPPTGYGGTSHWHAMRKQLLERRVVKQIPLTNGNLIMDVPVPKGVIHSGNAVHAEKDEMTSMRYSAATCDPDDFMRNKFNLRPYLYGRKTELFVSHPPPTSRSMRERLTTDCHDNVQRDVGSFAQDTQLGHQEHCASVYEKQVQDVGPRRVEKGRRLHCRRWTESGGSQGSEGIAVDGHLCRGETAVLRHVKVQPNIQGVMKDTVAGKETQAHIFE